MGMIINWFPIISVVWQTVTEKHRMNVPETMNEVLDMSDDEGKEDI